MTSDPRDPLPQEDPRDHVAQGVNVARLRLEAKRALPSLPVILLGIVATLAGGALLFSQLTPTLFKSTRELSFAVDDGFGILEGVDEVRYRGVPAGTIQKIERDGTQLVLKIKLREELPVYRDVRAELRPETPLNDMYLDIIDPGHAKASDIGGATVPEGQTDTNVKINDVLNALGSSERTRLAQLMDNLGNGLADRGDALRAAITEFIPFIRSAGPIAGALADREAVTKRLVSNARILTEELGRRERQIRTLVREGSATLGTLQAGSSDLDATLRELAPTTTEIDTSLAALTGVLDPVDAAVGDLYPVAERLPAALDDVRDLESDLGPAVRRLQRPVQRLVPLAAALQPLARDLDRTSQALQPQLGSIDKITRSVERCEDAIQNFFQWNASLSKFGDVRGPVPRGNLAFGVPDTGAPGLALRKPAPNCAGGVTIPGRVPRAEDEG